MPYSALNITRQFSRVAEEKGIRKPTEIQSRAIPPLLSGQDVIGLAPTGTGKTLAFALPILQTVKFHREKGPFVLILTPSKELAIQIGDVIKEFSVYTDIKTVALYGGVGKTEQVKLIESGCDILISTPGRFKELYYQGNIYTKNIKQLVLDEADRMMDMGFMPQLRDILEILPTKRQNMLFSATFPEKVQYLSQEFLDFPLRIEVKGTEKAVSTVQQFKIFLKNKLCKANYLLHILQQPDYERVLVFARTKESATHVGKFLQRKMDAEVKILHGNKAQNARINAFRLFQEGEVKVLVTTEVASRGIDVPDVSHVIHLDAPGNKESYIHRTGRTGRAFKTGVSILFYNEAENYFVERLEKQIGENLSEIKPEIELNYDFLEGEKKEIAIEIDRQKRKENPDYQGAFHEKGSRKKKIFEAKKLRKK